MAAAALKKGCVIVVGVGPGLGGAIAKKFAKEGYVVALISRTADKRASTVAEIAAGGGVVKSYDCDSSDESAIKAVAKQIISEIGPPAVLAYNAAAGGSWPPPSFLDTSVDTLRKVTQAARSGFFFMGLNILPKSLDVTLVGAFVWAQQVLPVMLQEGSGTLLFTGATSAMRGAAKFCGFSPAKFGLRSLSQSLAREFGPKNIHVAHVIVDGIILLENTLKHMPGRPDGAFLQPEAMADNYYFLHTQHKSTWTQELDLRPFCETF